MTLKFVPSDNLVFKGPFNKVSITDLQLTNIGDECIVFKILTTMPKYVCVRPNNGLIESHATRNIQITLLPSANSQQLNDRAKIKFLIKWMPLPRDYTDTPGNFWKQDVSKLKEAKDEKLYSVFIDEQSVTVPIGQRDLQETLLLNGSITDAIKIIEATAKVSDELINQINEMTGELNLMTYIITRKNNEEYTINENMNTSEVATVVFKWQDAIELIIIEDVFNDKIDYRCNTYEDMIRLNRDMLTVVKKYESFDNEPQCLQVVNKFYQNFLRIQEALQKLLLFLRTGGQCHLNDIKQRLNKINNELKDLQNKYKNVTFA